MDKIESCLKCSELYIMKDHFFLVQVLLVILFNIKLILTISMVFRHTSSVCPLRRVSGLQGAGAVCLIVLIFFA